MGHSVQDTNRRDTECEMRRGQRAACATGLVGRGLTIPTGQLAAVGCRATRNMIPPCAEGEEQVHLPALFVASQEGGTEVSTVQTAPRSSMWCVWLIVLETEGGSKRDSGALVYLRGCAICRTCPRQRVWGSATGQLVVHGCLWSAI